MSTRLLKCSAHFSVRASRQVMFDTVVVVDSPAAWRAPIAGFISEFLIVGFGLSNGIILIGLHDDYEVSHELQLVTSLVGVGLMLILAPAMECVTIYIGSKACVLTSTVLMTMSTTLLFFLPITGVSVFVLLGLCNGVGRTFGNFVFYKYTMIAFKKRRGAASAVLKTGASVGAIVFPPLYAVLIDFYGARITVFLVGGIFLNLLVAFLLVPSVVIDDKTGRRLTPLPKYQCCCRSRKSNYGDHSHEEEDSMKESMKMIKEPLPVTLPYLIFVCAVICICGIGTIACLNVYALYTAEVGLSKYVIAAAMSTRSGVDLFTRLVVAGFLFDKVGKRGKFALMSLSQFIGFVGILPLFFAASLEPTITVFIHGVTLAVMNGIGAVGWMQVIPLLSGNSYLGRVLSTTMLITGGGLITFSLAFGYLKRVLGTYKPLYYVSAGFCGASVILFLSAALLFYRCSVARPQADAARGEVELNLLDQASEARQQKGEEFISSHSLNL